MGSRRSKDPLPAPATDGLNALDRDRASSVADEGGVSASALDAREDDRPSDLDTRERVRVAVWPAAVLAAVGVIAAWNVLRRRGHA